MSADSLDDVSISSYDEEVQEQRAERIQRLYDTRKTVRERRRKGGTSSRQGGEGCRGESRQGGSKGRSQGESGRCEKGGLNLIVAMLFLSEPRSHRELAANLAHAAPDEGAVEGTTGAGVHDNAARAAGNTLAARASSVDTGLDYIPWSAGLLFAAGFLFMLGFASFESVTGYYLLDELFKGKYANPTQASGQFYGLLFTIAGIAMLLTALLVYKPMLGCIGEFPTVAVGGVLRFLGFIFMSMAKTPVTFAAACICQVVGGNLISPTTSSLLTTICSKKIYGRALGYQQSFQSVARIFAPTIFGYLYDQFDHRLTFWINAGTTAEFGAFDNWHWKRHCRAFNPDGSKTSKQHGRPGGGGEHRAYGTAKVGSWSPSLPGRRQPWHVEKTTLRCGSRCSWIGPDAESTKSGRGPGQSISGIASKSGRRVEYELARREPTPGEKKEPSDEVPLSQRDEPPEPLPEDGKWLWLLRSDGELVGPKGDRG